MARRVRHKERENSVVVDAPTVVEVTAVVVGARVVAGAAVVTGGPIVVVVGGGGTVVTSGANVDVLADESSPPHPATIETATNSADAVTRRVLIPRVCQQHRDAAPRRAGAASRLSGPKEGVDTGPRPGRDQVPVRQHRVSNAMTDRNPITHWSGRRRVSG